MGHVLPNIAVIDELKKLAALHDQKLDITYFGSYSGPERRVALQNKLKFKAVLCGKLRRYFAWQNFLDVAKIPLGIFQALFYLIIKRPRVIFSKGGFVSVPVCVAAWVLRIPLILHESDLSPGMANKICARFAKKICLSFEETKKFFPRFARRENLIITGNPVRKMVTAGDKKTGFEITHLPQIKAVLLVMGGSQGATQINDLIWHNLDDLLAQFSVVHITGHGHKKPGFKQKGYLQMEYAHEDLPHLYAMSDFIISRGGANSLWEIAAIGKPALIIPLMHASSRGDQVENAKIFTKKFGFLSLEGNFSNQEFLAALEKLKTVKLKKNALPTDAGTTIANLIFSFNK